MDRRTLLALPLGLVAPRAAGAQPSAKSLPRIGFLGNGSPTVGTEPLQAFLEGLRAVGWVDGKTVIIEYRWAEGDATRVPGLAAELAATQSDVLVVSGSIAVSAAKRATTRIPIVIAAILVDPVRLGLVRSLARPGGNVTGVASQYDEVVTKQVELLKQVLPGLARLAVLWDAQGVGLTRDEAVAAAEKLGVKARDIKVKDAVGFAQAFQAVRDGRAQAVHVLPSPFFNAHRRTLIELAARHRLPALYEFREFVQEGGLMSFGASITEMYRRAASYVDRILKGARPGDLPIERPAKFELVVNVRTARALGLTIPRAVLVRADTVIE